MYLDPFLYTAIDGDGMVVALTFVDGRVHLRSRFVASRERLEEQEKRKFIYRGQMGTHPNSALKDTASVLGNLLMLRLPKLRYRNPSNTNVYYWGGKVCMHTVCIQESKERELATSNQNMQGSCLAHVRINSRSVGSSPADPCM